jgi:hypothetical protein
MLGRRPEHLVTLRLPCPSGWRFSGLRFAPPENDGGIGPPRLTRDARRRKPA